MRGTRRVKSCSNSFPPRRTRWTSCAPPSRRSAPRFLNARTTPHPARDIADRLMASLGSMLLYWYHWTHNGRRVDVET
jgi:hypothetical protein